MENWHGLAVDGMVKHANGTAERGASEIMLKAKSKDAGRRITAGEDKAYDTADHVANLRASNVTPHVTQNNSVRPRPVQSREQRHRRTHTRKRCVVCIKAAVCGLLTQDQVSGVPESNSELPNQRKVSTQKLKNSRFVEIPSRDSATNTGNPGWQCVYYEPLKVFANLPCAFDCASIGRSSRQYGRQTVEYQKREA